MQDCSISIANALKILQSCTKPSISSKPQAGPILVEVTASRADSRFAPSQWAQSNDVSHWLGASLESALALRVKRWGGNGLERHYHSFCHAFYHARWLPHGGWDGGWGCLNVMAAILQTPQVKKVYRILNIIQQQCFTKTDAQNESQTAFFF